MNEANQHPENNYRRLEKRFDCYSLFAIYNHGRKGIVLIWNDKKRNLQAPDAKNINSGSSLSCFGTGSTRKNRKLLNQSYSITAESGTAVEPERDANSDLQSAKHRTTVSLEW